MIYLDNAATTYPKPQSVEKSILTAMHAFGANPGRGGYEMSQKTANMIFSCREEVSDFFGLSAPERVIFTANCTHSLNFVIKAFFKPGCSIVCSSLEHNAVMRPLTKLKKLGADIRIAKVHFDSPDRTVQNFKELIDSTTTLVICIHASNVCGFIMPVRQIGEICAQRNVPFCVDAAQTAGILPIDMSKDNIDFLCMPGHKGLYGPMGTGLLLCRKDLPQSIIEGGTGNLSFNLDQPDTLPEMLESGTLNVPGIAGLYSGIRFVKAKRIDTIRTHEHSFVKRCFTQLKDMKNIELYFDRFDEDFVPVLSFNIKDIPSEKAAGLLAQKGICVRSGLHCAPTAHTELGTLSGGTIRICPDAFNTVSQIPPFISAVKSIAR